MIAAWFVVMEYKLHIPGTILANNLCWVNFAFRAH
jgi:hypothetical protein